MVVHGQEIIAPPTAGVSVMFEAVVGGGIPVISPIKRESGCHRQLGAWHPQRHL